MGYGLGTYDDSPTMNILIEFGAEEYGVLADALNALDRLQPPFDYKLICRNFLDLQEVHRFVTLVLSMGRAFGTAEPRALGEAVMRSVVNWLTSVRLFLDHTETTLNRRFGESSDEFTQFQDATHLAYDSRVGYRFVSQFRNYVQHCGLPLSQIKLGARDGAAGSKLRQSAELLLNRDELLAYFDWKPTIRADLMQMEPSFSLLPLAEEAMEGLHDVHRATLEIVVDDALARTPVLTSALDRIQATGEPGTPALFTWRGDFTASTTLTPKLFSTEAIRKLNDVVEGSRPRESLFSGRDTAKANVNNSTIAAALASDERGVQVLTAFFAEGGPTTEFLRVVDEIMRTDGDTRPLMTGLINLCVLLVHLNALALGGTAEGLLAGLHGAYAEDAAAANP